MLLYENRAAPTCGGITAELSAVLQDVTVKRMTGGVFASRGDIQPPTPLGCYRATMISGGAP